LLLYQVGLAILFNNRSYSLAGIATEMGSNISEMKWLTIQKHCMIFLTAFDGTKTEYSHQVAWWLWLLYCQATWPFTVSCRIYSLRCRFVWYNLSYNKHMRETSEYKLENWHVLLKYVYQIRMLTACVMEQPHAMWTPLMPWHSKTLHFLRLWMNGIPTTYGG
jgi:hypothetical protein